MWWCRRLVASATPYSFAASSAGLPLRARTSTVRSLTRHSAASARTHHASIAASATCLRPLCVACYSLQLPQPVNLPRRTFASQKHRPRNVSGAPSATTYPHSLSAPLPPPPTNHAPPASYFTPSPSSSPADSGRLIYATTITLYARGVPYLFLFLLLPVVSFAIYATYSPSASASARPSASSYLSILPLTLLPLSFLLVVAAFARFNRRLVATIHLTPDRRLALTTVGMLPSSSSSPPHFIVRPLDALIPPYAWTGANDRTLHRLRFVREGEAGGVDEYWLYAAPSKAGEQGVELLRRIMTDNRLSSRELAL